MRVADVLSLLASGASEAEILEDYPYLTADDVKACLQHGAILGGDAPTVVWVRVGNTRRAALLVWFEPLIDEVISLVDAGNPLIEMR